MNRHRLKVGFQHCLLLLCLWHLSACNNYDSLEANELYELAQEASFAGKTNKALRLSKSAFQKGDIRAQVLLGNLLYESDPEIAFKHWNAAADAGEPSAKYILGFFAYTAGDDDKAAFWISDAAIQGDKQAQYLYARMYEEGRGVEHDPMESIYWLEKAAEQNHEYAQQQLELIEQQGRYIKTFR